jgi:hypothetical protein
MSPIHSLQLAVCRRFLAYNVAHVTFLNYSCLRIPCVGISCVSREYVKSCCSCDVGGAFACDHMVSISPRMQPAPNMSAFRVDLSKTAYLARRQSGLFEMAWANLRHHETTPLCSFDDSALKEIIDNDIPPTRSTDDNNVVTVEHGTTSRLVRLDDETTSEKGLLGFR